MSSSSFNGDRDTPALAMATKPSDVMALTLKEAKAEYRRLEIEAQIIDDQLRAKVIELEKLEKRLDNISWSQMDLMEQFGASL